MTLKQGHFSVAGLVADLIGFLILAYDLLPEYRINRSLHDLAVGFPAVLWVIKDHAERIERGATQIDLAAASVVGSFSYQLLNSALRRAKVPQVDEQASSEQVIAAADKANTILLKQKAEVADRTRPPINAGISLVVLGSLLQIAGSWPL